MVHGSFLVCATICFGLKKCVEEEGRARQCQRFETFFIRDLGLFDNVDCSLCGPVRPQQSEGAYRNEEAKRKKKQILKTTTNRFRCFASINIRYGLKNASIPLDKLYNVKFISFVDYTSLSLGSVFFVRVCACVPNIHRTTDNSTAEKSYVFCCYFGSHRLLAAGEAPEQAGSAIAMSKVFGSAWTSNKLREFL